MVFLAIELITVGIFLLIYTFYVEPNRRQINRHQVSLPKKLSQPLKILHLSDIHFAKFDRALFQFFDRLALEDYDLIFISGDIMDSREGLPYCVKELSKLKSKFGTFAVFGNHDYYEYGLWDVFTHNAPGHGYPLKVQPAHLFKEALEGIGIKVLRNDTAKVMVGDEEILIHGLDDPTTGRANIRKAMSFFDAQKINILLTHSIDAFLDIGADEIDLSFSGHSHGGQICFPFVGPLITHTIIGRDYVSGVKQLKGAACSISRGMGASRVFKFRLLSPPEAIVLTVSGKN